VSSCDGEVPLQVGGAAGEAAGQAAGDEVAIGCEYFGARDLGRVGVFRGRAGLPGADLGGAPVFFAFVDDGGVIGEEVDDRVDVPIGVMFKVARDDVRNFGGRVLLEWATASVGGRIVGYLESPPSMRPSNGCEPCRSERRVDH
jgi:hypothetical protein